MQIAREQWNLTPAEVGSALKAQGINEFDPGKWLEMKQIVLDFAMAKQTANSPLVKTNAETT